MPIYEYSCEKCGVEFEVEQRITENPLTVHEDCGGAVKRLISLTSFTLKGSGWYADHYGLKNGGNGSAKEKTKEPAETKSTETKKEPKSEPASTPKAETKTSSGSSTSVGNAA